MIQYLMEQNSELQNLTDCQYTGDKENYPLNFSHYVRNNSLTIPISNTEYVRRYVSEKNSYPEGMIEDNLSNHLQRSFNHISKILKITDEGEVDKEKAILTLLLHDLGETRASTDECTIDNPNNSKLEYEHFLTIINTPFSSKEEIENKIDCYNQYQECSSFLKGKGEPRKIVDREFITGLLVRTVDILDGNLYLHKNLREWIEKGNKFPEDHRSIPHMFDQRFIYLQQLDTLPDFKTKPLLKFLINSQIDYVKKIWEGNEHKMPDSLYKRVYEKSKPIPFFKGNTVNIDDYKAVNLEEDPSLAVLFDNVICYYSLDNGIEYPAKYVALSNKKKKSFLLSISSNGKTKNLFIKTRDSMNKQERNLIDQNRERIEEEIKKGRCVADITYGKKTRQYFAITEDGEPYTFGIANINK